MARHDPNVLLFKPQPTSPLPAKSEADQMDEILMVLNVAEQIPILSQPILNALDEGEAYETIARMVGTLHANLADLSEAATRAKYIEL